MSTYNSLLSDLKKSVPSQNVQQNGEIAAQLEAYIKVLYDTDPEALSYMTGIVDAMRRIKQYRMSRVNNISLLDDKASRDTRTEAEIRKNEEVIKLFQEMLKLLKAHIMVNCKE